MPLDPTLSEQCFRNSIKKYFVDTLQTVDGVYVGFETEYKQPEDVGGNEVTEWINFHFNGVTSGNAVSTGRVAAYLFTRKDTDGANLATLRDKLMSRLVDLSATDGIMRIPLYDLTWTATGVGIMLHTGNESVEERGKDGTLYKFLNIYCRFANV
jgi:hypothetical protein